MEFMKHLLKRTFYLYIITENQYMASFALIVIKLHARCCLILSKTTVVLVNVLVS